MTKEEANAAFVGALQRGLAERGLYAGKLDSWASPGGPTQKALEAALGWKLPVAAVPGLPGFRGDLARVHRWEGHNGRPYWPGGASGVTLDPGFDLGYQNRHALSEHYAFLGQPALDALAGALGIRGAPAKAAAARPEVRAVRISEAQAIRVMPAIAASYWSDIVRRFPKLSAAPDGVQTALLSLAYNRGAGNRELTPLAEPIAAGRWQTVADLIASMQQDHKLAGIRSRRREEAAVIRGDLKERRA